MAKVKISREKLEKILIVQLNCNAVTWDKTGNVNIELDLEKLKEKEHI